MIFRHRSIPVWFLRIILTSGGWSLRITTPGVDPPECMFSTARDNCRINGKHIRIRHCNWHATTRSNCSEMHSATWTTFTNSSFSIIHWLLNAMGTTDYVFLCFPRTFLPADCSVARTVLLASLHAFGSMLAMYMPGTRKISNA